MLVLSSALLAVTLLVGADTTSAPDPEQALVAHREAVIALLPALRPPADDVLPAWARESDHPIDRFLAARWLAAELPDAEEPPPLCDDRTFARRAYLDLIGVIPTREQMNAFLADPSPDRRGRLVDQLLDRSADWADHWTPFWEDAFASSPVAVNGGMATRGNWQRWINDAVRENVSYDVFAASVIDPAMPRAKPVERGNANGLDLLAHFILNASETDTVQSAAAVSQVFMGTAMKCGSCHNHFENDEWPQRRVIAFAGLFADADLEMIRCERRTGRVIPAAFPFAIGDEAESEPAPAGADARRAIAARALVDPRNPRFAPSIVNRLWKRFVGLGLVEPIDDFRDDRAAADPALLAFLADDLMRHGFDLRHTTRLILTSRAYQHSYDPEREDRIEDAATSHDQDAVAADSESLHAMAPRWHRSPTLRRLTAEQIVDSLRVAMAQELDPRSRLFRTHESTGLSRALGRPAARNEISTARSDEPSIIASLELLNGPEFAALLADGPLYDAALAAGSPEAAATVLFEAILSRPPSGREAMLAAAALANGGTTEGSVDLDALRDLAWALAVSSEFMYVH